MRTRFVPAVIALTAAALLSGCSNGSFVFNATPDSAAPVTQPVQQSSGDDAGLNAFAQRSEAYPDEGSSVEATATNNVDSAMSH